MKRPWAPEPQGTMKVMTIDWVPVTFAVLFLGVGAVLALDLKGAASGVGALSEMSAHPLRTVPPWRWLRSSRESAVVSASRTTRLLGVVFVVTGAGALFAAVAGA